MKKFFALFMMAVFVLGTLVLPASATSQVTFHVNPTDATVTFNGVTKQASNGVVSFEAEAGTYDCQVAKTGYIWQEGTVAVEGNSEYTVILAADSAKSYWTFDEDLEGWTCNNAADTLSHEDGALKLEMASNDPGVSKDITPNLDMTGRDRVVLTYRKVAASESDLLIYFKSVVNGTSYNHAGSRALTKTLPAQTDGYVTEVFPANEYFAGTLENLRIDPITSASGLTGAAFYIDKLEIPKISPLVIEGNQYLKFSVSPATAEIALFDEAGTLVAEQCATAGEAFFVVDEGSYTYTVEKFGYKSAEGSVEVAGDMATVEVSLTPLESYYSYDFSEKASVAQIMADGWNISDPDTLTIDETYGIQTGVAGVENTFSYMLDEAIDHGTIEVALEIMGSKPVAGGYFDATLRPTPQSANLAFFVTGPEGDVFQYKTTGNATQALSERFDFTGELHTLSFVINLDTGSLKVKHDGAVILPYAAYGSKAGGNTFAGIYMHYKPDCEFYWKSIKVSHSNETVPTETPVWIDYETEPGDFSLVVLPDTQILPTGAPNTLSLMAQWVLENKEKENIQYVISVGDVTGNNSEAAWESFMSRFSILDGEIPMAFVPGNHDYEGLDPWGGADVGVKQDFRSTKNFNKYIPYEKVSAYPTFGGAYEEGKTENTYHCFQVGNMKYMLLNLEFAPRDSVVAWANEVVEQHPNHNVIVTTHAYMDGIGARYDENHTYPLERYLFVRSEEDDCNNAQKLWDKLLKKHKNIFLVLNGHSSPNDVRRRVDLGENGNQVYQLCVDATALDRGDFSYGKGAGMMLQMRFKENGTKIDCSYYSGFYGKYYKEENQFTINVDAAQLVYDDSDIAYYIDGEAAEVSSLEKNEYILSEGSVSVVAENPARNNIFSVTYENGKITSLQSSDDENVNMTLTSTENSVIKTFVWNTYNSMQPLAAPYVLSRQGYAKVTITGTENASAKMRNTTTNKTYDAFGSIPYGLYEYVVTKEGYISQTGYLSVSEDCTIEADLTPDEAKHQFNFATSADGFTTLSDGATSYPIENGVGLQLQNGAYIENNTMQLDVTNRSRLVLTYKNPSPYTNLQIQYKIKGSDIWASYQTVINGYCTEFITTTLDLRGASSFKGTLEGLRIGLATGADTPANIELRSLSIMAEEEVNCIDGGHLSFQCNEAGAKIMLSNPEIGRSYERVIEEAGGVADFGEMLFGVYEYLVYKPGYSVQKGTVTLEKDMPVLQVTLTADDQIAAYSWNFQDSVEDFTGYNTNSTSVNQADGCLVITATNADPYAYTQNVTKNLGDRKMVVLRYKNQAPYTVFTLYYVTSESGGYQKKAAVVQSTMSDFENLYIDLSDMAEWSGTLRTLRLDPEGMSGMQPTNFYVDSIELLNINTVNY